VDSLELSALLVFMTATTFTPGPNTALSTTLAVNHGLRGALRFVSAVPIGWLLMLGITLAGLGPLVNGDPTLQQAIRVVGCTYLVWLAWQLAKSTGPKLAQTQTLQVGFIQGVMLQFLNIKAWMFCFTLTSGWLTAHDDWLERTFVVATAMAVFGFASNLTYASIGAVLREWLSGPNHSHQRLRRFNQIMASVLLVTALWLIQG
jgi:threonine/homoserine/homoserine lactone efflux protein